MARDNAYIPVRIRTQVALRAGYCCKYCLLGEDQTGLACEVDHVIGVKHRGQTELSNLADACFICNRSKGSDIGSIHWPTKQYLRFLNSRTDFWSEHFRFKKQYITSLTPIGWVTEQILRFNDIKRLNERNLFS